MRKRIAESGGVTNVKKAANQFRSSGEMSRANMRRGFTMRQVGLALAAGTAIASIAIVATLVLRSPTKRSAVVSPAAPSVPDVREMPTGDAPTLGSGDQFFIQFVDRWSVSSDLMLPILVWFQCHHYNAYTENLIHYRFG